MFFQLVTWINTLARIVTILWCYISPSLRYLNVEMISECRYYPDISINLLLTYVDGWGPLFNCFLLNIYIEQQHISSFTLFSTLARSHFLLIILRGVLTLLQVQQLPVISYPPWSNGYHTLQFNDKSFYVGAYCYDSCIKFSSHKCHSISKVVSFSNIYYELTTEKVLTYFTYIGWTRITDRTESIWL